jgi:lipopolysaccharide/colanic/teichoic acid biosynthesis glycosyltransferase
MDRKRAFDLAVSLPAALLSLPVQGVVALAIRCRMGSPVLFRQPRPGLHGQVFEVVKFRTMLPVDASRGWVDDASRLTGLGRWLRASSLDELPTLWNVVRGEMSLVGPRPLLVDYLDRYTPAQARRHQVRPGITGLAQVNGRNATTWSERLRLDVQYVDTHTMRGDLRILARTVRAVLSRHGISAPGAATMPEFTGVRVPVHPDSPAS